MKFIANMGISPDTVAFLRGLGYDAIHLDKEGLGALPDPQILAKPIPKIASCSRTIWILAI
jgi:hypothetical protein